MIREIALKKKISKDHYNMSNIIDEISEQLHEIRIGNRTDVDSHIIDVMIDYCNYVHTTENNFGKKLPFDTHNQIYWAFGVSMGRSVDNDEILDIRQWYNKTKRKEKINNFINK